MTHTEFGNFAAEAMLSRWTEWHPTAVILEDWFLVFRRCPVDVAQAIIREHYTTGRYNRKEPQIDVVSGMVGRAMRNRSCRALPEEFVPWVRCIVAPPEHPDWAGREWIRTEYRTSVSSRSQQPAAEAARMAAGMAARAIQQAEGGQWSGVVRPHGQSPVEYPEGDRGKEAVRNDILNGPDGPDRRFLLGRSGKLLPGLVAELTPDRRTTDPPKTVATRQELADLARTARQDQRSASGESDCTIPEEIVDPTRFPDGLPPADHEDLSDADFFAANPVEEDGQWETG